MGFLGGNLSSEETLYFDQLRAFIKRYSPIDVAASPFLFANRFTVTEAMIRFELYRHVINVAGSFVECGTATGSNLMLLAHMSSILEPYAITRKIIGFDTFKGFASVDHKYDPKRIENGSMDIANYDTLLKSVELYDMNRAVGHMERVEVVKGDACKTIPQYVKAHPELNIALLYMDFDIYRPTKKALELLLPRVCKGGIVAFDQYNYSKFPGETIAALEECNIHQEAALQRLPWAPFLAFYQV